MTIDQAITFLEGERLTREGRIAVRVLRKAVESIRAGAPATEVVLKSFHPIERIPAPLATQNHSLEKE
jgi:hypothetical protein